MILIKEAQLHIVGVSPKAQLVRTTRRIIVFLLPPLTATYFRTCRMQELTHWRLELQRGPHPPS